VSRRSVFAGVAPAVQKLALRGSFRWHRLIRARRGSREIDWVVGPFEIAGVVYRIASVLPSAETALLQPHPFYRFHYDWIAPQNRTNLRQWLTGPWKLGELMARAKGFVYVSDSGFLDALGDARRFEFAFLKKHGKKIVCYFTGSDIRSLRLMAERERRTGLPNIATYIAETDSRMASAEYESIKLAIGKVADAYADMAFNADVDQQGYLDRASERYMYFYPDNEVTDDFGKFENVTIPVIVHAASSPVIKGTQLVRAAIEELRSEGRSFEYIELVRQPHAEVQQALSRAHIVLNHFYGETPAVFGVESLAAGCVVMMRADEHIEPMLPEGSNSAWVVTRHFEVTKNLRTLLDNPEGWERQARAGVTWVRENAAVSVTGTILREKLARLI
jgi:hypothetical protein